MSDPDINDAGIMYGEWQKAKEQLTAKDMEIERLHGYHDGLFRTFAQEYTARAEKAEAGYAARAKQLGQRALRLREEIHKRIKAEARVKELEAEAADLRRMCGELGEHL